MMAPQAIKFRAQTDDVRAMNAGDRCWIALADGPVISNTLLVGVTYFHVRRDYLPCFLFREFTHQ
jgi:hypothetical protein